MGQMYGPAQFGSTIAGSSAMSVSEDLLWRAKRAQQLHATSMPVPPTSLSLQLAKLNKRALAMEPKDTTRLGAMPTPLSKPKSLVQYEYCPFIL